MRWGITPEIEDEQLVTEVCLNEIEKCQNQSLGPYFVVSCVTFFRKWD